MATFNIAGHLQYKTQAEGDACNAWLTNWIIQHQAEIVSGSHSLTNTLVPDTGEGCVVQLNLGYHFNSDVPGASNSYYSECDTALQATFGTSDCNSDLTSGSP